nr:hypothetical protein [Celerinatantimonas diazotrophica]
MDEAAKVKADFLSKLYCFLISTRAAQFYIIKLLKFIKTT